MRSGVKTILVSLVAALLVTGLVACGGGGEATSSGDNGDAPKIGGTITIWDRTYRAFPAYTSAIDQIDRAFEALHPGVKVNHVAQPAATFEQVLQAAFTAREGPDIVRLAPGASVVQWSKGLERLDDRISDEMRENLSGWNTTGPGYSGERDIYGVPYGVIGDVFYYNKKLFRRAGLPTDFQPQTWEEVKEAGEKLKAAGIQPFADGNKEGYANGWWLNVGWQTANTADDLQALANGETSFTSDAVAAAYAPHIMMQEAGLFEDDRFTTPLQPDGVARFGEGDVGMFLGKWALTAYYVDYNAKLGEENVGIFFPPGSNYISVNPNGVLSITNFSENQDTAWAYLEFISEARNAQTLYEVGGVLPNHKDVEPLADAPVQERELIAAMRENETFPQAELMFPGPVMATMYAEINEVLQGRKPLAEAQQAL
ncbi:MAG TPA: extracellular solute-binding protein, partial [Conexibacter sp.]|nr:extracellular solute-binding protein [Conexibacter sp.]